MKEPISIEQYTYDLPDERIAKFPLLQRDQSKLLFYNKGEISHHTFTNLPELLPREGFLFFNNTKVIPARLHFRRETGALIEVFLLHPVLPSKITSISMAARGQSSWHCMVGNLKKWKEGEVLRRQFLFNNRKITITATLADRAETQVTLNWQPEEMTLAELLEISGQIPIPPYLNREATEADKEAYQTVYAENEGSVAAPTAGLHFTDAVFENLDKKGISHDFITLHVGAGTFQPVKAEDVRQHPMHREQIVFSLQNIENLLKHHEHIVAVGTTTMRALESLYWYGVKLHSDSNSYFFIEKLYPYHAAAISTEQSLQTVYDFMRDNSLQQLIGETEIIILPGYDFKICRTLVTNFHQPASTLLMLVDAFIGGHWRKLYQEAMANNYRFLSYGDSSLLVP